MSLSIKELTLEFLDISRDFNKRVPVGMSDANYDLFSFNQKWYNKYGGFKCTGNKDCNLCLKCGEEFDQRVNVFVPVTQAIGDICIIYFGGVFAYKIPFSAKLKEDIINMHLRGYYNKSRYWQELEAQAVV